MMPRTLMKLSFVALTAAQLLTVAPTAAGAQAAAPGTSISPSDDSIYPKVAAYVVARSLPAPSLPRLFVEVPTRARAPRCLAASVHADRLAFWPLARPDHAVILREVPAPGDGNPSGCSRVIM